MADGTYTGEGNRDIDFNGKAITLRSENGPENCIIDVKGPAIWLDPNSHRGFYFHQAEDANSILEGFTIINGAISGDISWFGIPWNPDPWHQDPNHTIGGGIYCELASPTIINCVIRYCWAQLGGGIGCVGSTAVITNCTVDDCWSGHLGLAESGGLGAGIGLIEGCNVKITDCTITNNMGYWNAAGGGVYCIDSSAEIKGGTICGNSAYAGFRIQGGITGAGVYCGALSNMTLEDCVIAKNYGMNGAGMYNQHSSPTVTNCKFIRNWLIISGYNCHGGGIYNYQSSPTVTNCTFSGNFATTIDPSNGYSYGGGMYNYGSSPTLVNCTFSENKADEGNALACYSDQQENPSNLQLANCILWDGGDEIWNYDGSAIAVTYSNVEGSWPGEGNIDSDPMFVDANGADDIIGTEDDNVRLMEGSPCIDAGDNLAVPPLILTELDGLLRFADDPNASDTGNGTPPIVDMGAYERCSRQGFTILLNAECVTVPEGETAMFTVALSMDPNETVEVIVTRESGDPDITVESGALLTFDSSNYSVPQTVTLAAAEDGDCFHSTAVFWVSALESTSR